MQTAKQRTVWPKRMRISPNKEKTPELDVVRNTIGRIISRVHILDKTLALEWIRQRQKLGIDKYDEVWEGVYVGPPLARNPHQGQVGCWTAILHEVVFFPGKGQVFPGVNVSDREEDWEKNFRCPDVAVALKGGRATDCGTHWFGGPDFLLEVKSPRDETEEKIPFYGKIQVQELVIVERDSRKIRLLRHNGEKLVEVPATLFQGEKWLVSKVLPLAFRKVGTRKNPRTEVCRTDGVAGRWTF